MAKIYNNKAFTSNSALNFNFNIGIPAPFDTRSVVETFADLSDDTLWGNTRYVGMIVAVIATNSLYQYTSTGTWKEVGTKVDLSAQDFFFDPGGQRTGDQHDVRMPGTAAVTAAETFHVISGNQSGGCKFDVTAVAGTSIDAEEPRRPDRKFL